MSESALVKFVSVVNCSNRKLLFTYSDAGLKKAYKDEYLREVQQVIIEGLVQSTLYDGFTDVSDSLSGTWHTLVQSNTAFSRKFFSKFVLTWN